MDDEQERRDSGQESAIPKWMLTFADMMTLLMCFFVLLLTFAEMDIQRYRQIAGAMAEGFGVQRVVTAEQIPMGTSIIAQEFSPGRPQPTPISEIYQQADALPDLSLMTESTPEPVEPPAPEEQERAPPEERGTVELTGQMKLEIQALIAKTREDAAALAGELADEIARGEVEIETRARTIVLRIREKGSFDSGSAELRPEYRRLMHEVRDRLAKQPGALSVRGHTDDIPIATERFRSNWELSSARAVSVAHELLTGGTLDPRRFSVIGYADTRPLAANDSAENRARNRRVEIVIDQGIDRKAREQLEVLKTADPEYYRSLGLEQQFEMAPEDVF